MFRGRISYHDLSCTWVARINPALLKRNCIALAGCILFQLSRCHLGGHDKNHQRCLWNSTCEAQTVKCQRRIYHSRITLVLKRRWRSRVSSESCHVKVANKASSGYLRISLTVSYLCIGARPRPINWIFATATQDLCKFWKVCNDVTVE